MAKDVINVDGENVEVREDTAKSYRGVMWALISVGAFAVIAAILFFVFFSASVADGGDQKNPAEVEQQRQ